MSSLVPFDSLDAMLKSTRVNELLKYNEELQKHGLVLSSADAEEIIIERSRALKNQGRVELDLEVTKALAIRLCGSDYISQENYVQTITEAYETFHFIKNETSDFISDEDIINAIIVYYEKVCGGSAELLMGKGVEKIISNFKEQKKLTDIERQGDEEDWNFDE